MIAVYLIKIPQWGTLTLVELVWLLAGVAAIASTGRNLPRLWAEWRRARTVNEVQGILSRQNLRLESGRFATGAIILGIGIYAGTQPNAAPGPAYVTPAGLAITALFVLLGYHAPLFSWWDERDRRLAGQAILRQIERERLEEVARHVDKEEK